jgi:DNA polymerase, archaea type
MAGDRRVRLYLRTPTGVQSRFEDCAPWLVLPVEAAARIPYAVDERRLSGDQSLAVLKEFPSFSRWRDAYQSVQDLGIPFLGYRSPVEQFMVRTGITLFQGMEIDDLVRAQLDIETTGLDPFDQDNEIVIVTVSVNGHEPVVFHQQDISEPEMIRAVTGWIQAQDPDVIEGHNIFNFDIPFLQARARHHGISLDWGRDGSAVRQGNTRRFKVGPRSIPYDPAYAYGRHIIDTYQQIQRYDTAGRLNSYGLKESIEELGLERPERVHIPGHLVAEAWRNDRQRLIDYAVDDVRDTNTLSELALPTEFYQSQVLPGSLQTIATRGTGEKVNDLLLRAYITQNESIPLPGPSRPYPGGYTALRAVGVFGPVINADVESLYPSIMLRDEIRPASDRLDVFLPSLEVLTKERLGAKAQAARSSGQAAARWYGVQSSLKVLINSFYGYLGYSRGFFNDFDAAARVTLQGHEIIQQVERALTTRGARVIEVDTDGLYFEVGRQGSEDPEVEAELISEISDELGSRISLASGGRWKAMLSLKLKNYALLTHDNELLLRGSSLRSRRDEPYLRNFIRSASLGLLDPEVNTAPRNIYLNLCELIQSGALPASDFARTETITDATFTSEAGKRLAQAAAGERIGERVQVYQRLDGSLGRVEDYANDEDREYLLRRLRDVSARFRPLFDSDEAFDYAFPTVTTRTDLEALRRSEPVAQQRLF